MEVAEYTGMWGWMNYLRQDNDEGLNNEPPTEGAPLEELFHYQVSAECR